MEGISFGIPDELTISSSNIFAIVNFKHDDMTGYWPYSQPNRECGYSIENGIPTMEEEVLLSAKCLIKW
jgi:hypothetical protein